MALLRCRAQMARPLVIVGEPDAMVLFVIPRIILIFLLLSWLGLVFILLCYFCHLFPGGLYLFLLGCVCPLGWPWFSLFWVSLC